MMNNELQRKRPWPIIMPRKCIQSHGKFQDIWCSGQDLNRGSSGYSADEQTARCGESERHLVLAGGSSVQQARGQSADQPTKQTPHPTLDTTRPPALPGSSPSKNASVQIRASYLQTGRTSAGRWTWQRASSRLAGCRLWGGKTTRWSGSRRTRAPSFGSATCHSWGPSSDTPRRGTEENSEWH